MLRLCITETIPSQKAQKKQHLSTLHCQGQQFDPEKLFTKQQKIGHGSFGKVYKGYDITAKIIF